MPVPVTPRDYGQPTMPNLPQIRTRSLDPKLSLGTRNAEAEARSQQDRAFRLEAMIAALTQQMGEAKEKWTEISSLVGSHHASIDKKILEHHGSVQEALRRHSTSMMLISGSADGAVLQEIKEQSDKCLRTVTRIQENQEKGVLAFKDQPPPSNPRDQFLPLQSVAQSFYCRDDLESAFTKSFQRVYDQLTRIEDTLLQCSIPSENGHCHKDGAEIEESDTASPTTSPLNRLNDTHAPIAVNPLNLRNMPRSSSGTSNVSADSFTKGLERTYNTKHHKLEPPSSLAHMGSDGNIHIPAGVSKKYASSMDGSEVISSVGSFSTAPGIRNSWLHEAMFKARLQKQGEAFQWLLQRLLFFHTWWHSLQEPKRTGMLANIVQSSCFEAVCIMVILFNSVFVANVANWAMENLEKNNWPEADKIEFALIGFYTVELCLRLCVHRLYFFFNSEFGWNWFDFALVVTSLTDQVLRIVAEGAGENIFVMRVFRFLKLVRALRSLRAIRFCKELLILMTSLKKSFVALFWSVILVMMSLYVFSVIFLQALGDKLKDEKCWDYSCEEYGAVQEFFGTMPKAMLSLCMAMTGGRDWGEFYTVIQMTGKAYSMLFLFFIFYVMFALVNVMGAIFVEKAMSAAAPDRDGKILEQRRKNIEDAASFRELCHRIVGFDKDTISWVEFRNEIDDEATLMYLASIGLQVHNVRLFFNIVAGAGDQDEVSIDRFVEGCMQMTGNATAIDMQRSIYQMESIHSDLRTLGHLVLSNLREIKKLESRQVSQRSFNVKRSKSPQATTEN